MTATLHEPADVCAITAVKATTATLALAEGRDTAAVSGNLLRYAMLPLVERRDTASITGTVAFLTTATLPLVERGDSAVISETSDFIARRTSAGVFRWFDFDSAGQLGLNISGGGSLGNTSTTSFGYATGGGPNATTPSLDTTRGALHLQVLQGSTNDGPGKWQTKFSDDNSRVFRSNCEFYAQFAFEHDGYYSPDAPGVGYGPKFAYFGGDNVGSTSEFSILVIPTYYAKGLPFIYTYIPVYGTYGLGPYDAGIGGNDIQENCPYPYSAGTCVAIPANKKVWFQIGVQLGNFVTGTDPNGGSYAAVEAAVQMWITVDGVTTQFVDWTSSQPGQFPFMTDPSHSGNAFSRFMFDAYQTSKDPAEAHSTYNQYYDELILSTQRIPDPSTRPASGFPTWRQALQQNVLTNITSDATTSRSAYIAAGYYLPGVRDGAQAIATQNLVAWGAGVLVPEIGQAGRLLFGSDGHEEEPSGTLHQFDLWDAKWVAPVAAPQCHRVVSPSFTAPPADAEIFYDPTNHLGKFDITTYGPYTSTGAYGSAGTVYNGMEALIIQYIEGGYTLTMPSGFAIGDGYSVAKWPPSYNFRYNTYSPSSMRYNSLCAIPAADSSTTNGMVLTIGQVLPHRYDGGGSLNVSKINNGGQFVGPTENAGPVLSTGRNFAWGMNIGAGAWTLRSANELPPPAARSIQQVTAYSKKYRKVITMGGQIGAYYAGTMGYYDPLTNQCGWYNCIPYEYTQGALQDIYGTDVSSACITNGFESHLLVSVGVSPTTRTLGIFVFDVDAAVAAPVDLANPQNVVPGPGTIRGWLLMNPDSPDLDPASQRVGLLQTMNWLPEVYTRPGCCSVMWSETHRRILIWQGARGVAEASNPSNLTPLGTGWSAPLLTGNLHIVTIPTGSTGGVANWKTQPWLCEVRALSLAAGTTGISTGTIGNHYGRVQYSDVVDCLLNASNPVELPVQAIKVFT